MRKRSKGKYNLCIISLVVGLLFILQACSVEKFIPEDKLLYTGAKINVTSDTIIENISELKEGIQTVLRPEPNSKILGMRPGLYFHYKANREKPGFLNKFLNKQFGEEPVYRSEVQPYEMEQLLLNRLENKGFFYSQVSGRVEEDTTNQSAKAFYNVKVEKPYLLKTYQLDTDTLPVYQRIQERLSETVLKEQMRFDLTAMKAERERIDSHLKRQGYYNFNSNFLIFESDTNQYDKKRFDLYLRLKKDVPKKSIIPYKISKINIYPNNVVDQDSTVLDTVRFAEKNFMQETEFFKPKRLDPFILLEEGQLYNPETSRSTSRRLGSIGAYKFINIRYDELDIQMEDSLALLEANIYLSPLNKRALRAELRGVTKSNGFAGPSIALTFTNRNLFHGGETLNISADFGYEVQAASGSQNGLTSIQLGLNNELIFPRMLFPIKISDDYFEYAIPKTRVRLGVDVLKRSQLFTLASATTSFGYIWQANRFVTHEYNPISLNYVNLTNTTPEFEEILDNNPFLRTSFNQQFISGMLYSFTYNEMIAEQRTNQFYVNFNFDTAGNSLGLLSSGREEGEPQTIFGLEFAQYAKADVDLRYHFNFANEQKIATRLFAGYGMPYGNSDVLPYTKQYFSGGPYSVRAFRIRSLGPGTYRPEDGNRSAFFDQTGNVRLEANVEYRFPIINVLKGAVFADAGNIWNTSENQATPGGLLTSDFINEMGIGVGFGLRVDVQNFVIRLDLAAPLHDPAEPEGQRWVNDFTSPVLNFAVGYPF